MSSGKKPLLLLAMFLLGTVLFLTFFVFEFESLRGVFLPYFIFGLLVFYLLIFKFPKDPLEPIIAVTVLYFFYFYWRGLYLNYEEYFHINWVVLDNIGLLNKAMYYATAGVLFFFIGYYLPFYRILVNRLKSIKCEWNSRIIAKKAKTLFFIGLPFTITWIWDFRPFNFGAEFTPTLFMMLSQLSYMGIFVYGAHYFSRENHKQVSKRWFIFMIMTLFFISILTGHREIVMIVLFLVIVVRQYTKKSVSIRTLFKYILLCLVLIILLNPLIMAYREVAWQYKNKVDAFSAGVQEFPSSLNWVIDTWTEDREEVSTTYAYLNSSLNMLTFRFHGTDSLIASLAVVPEKMDFEKGRTIFFLPISAFVPRLIWPGKPETGLGEYFRDKIWSGTGGRIAIMQISELYINFGLIGIIIGMLVLGVFHRTIYEYFRKNFNYNTLLLYAFTYPSFLAIERDLSLVYASLIKVYIVLFFVIRYLNGKPLFKKA